MGLAGVFGDQGYVCEACGLAIELYTPHCPKCLNKNLTPIKAGKVPVGGLSTSGPKKSDTPKKQMSGSPASSFAAIGLILVIAIALYIIFGRAGSYQGFLNSLQQPRPEEAVTTDSSPAQPRVRRVSRPVRRPTASVRPQPARVTAPAATAAATPAPRRAPPMRLWQVEQEGAE